tara:strand:+ start:2338 stop:3156 length:819 start_codon:yes stop_codon:yes gene_type:complete
MKKFLSYIGLMKNKLKVLGIIPARLAASRFPNKPLKKIINLTMLEHVYERAKLAKNLDYLTIATCDKKIFNFSKKKNYNVIMTSKKHSRALDRVYEASKKLTNKLKLNKKDLTICIQADEPMLDPKMIDKSLIFLKSNKKAKCTILGMKIENKEQFYDKNILKIAHNLNYEVMYTSRSPIPYCKKFSKKMNVRRIYGIFAFRNYFLKKFYHTKPSPLEISEACDSNRICDNGGGQFVVKYDYFDSFSVDTEDDLKKVRKYIIKDKIYKRYNI